MAWIKPILDWQAGDGVMANDLHRIDGNLIPLNQTIDISGGGMFAAGGFYSEYNRPIILGFRKIVLSSPKTINIKILQIRTIIKHTTYDWMLEEFFDHQSLRITGGSTWSLNGCRAETWGEDNTPFSQNITTNTLEVTHRTYLDDIGVYTTVWGWYFSRIRLRLEFL